MSAILNAQHGEAHSLVMQQAWRRRKPWTRTESARWLNDRGPALLAHLRRSPGRWPEACPKQMGEWLKTSATPLFDHAHAALAARKTDEARDALGPTDLLP